VGYGVWVNSLLLTISWTDLGSILSLIFFFPEPPEPTLIASYSYLDLPDTLPPTPHTLPTLHVSCHPFRLPLQPCTPQSLTNCQSLKPRYPVSLFLEDANTISGLMHCQGNNYYFRGLWNLPQYGSDSPAMAKVSS